MCTVSIYTVCVIDNISFESYILRIVDNLFYGVTIWEVRIVNVDRFYGFGIEELSRGKSEVF